MLKWHHLTVQADGGRGICALFSSPPRGIWQLTSPHPREFAIQGKKNANVRGSARGGWGGGGGAGRSWSWLMHKFDKLYPRAYESAYNFRR